MQILQAQNIDLITPFPIAEIKRLVGWLHCYKSVMWADGLPDTDEAMEAYCLQALKEVLSFGVIDKNQSLGYKHEAPMIGVVWFEAGSTPANCYIHFASTRRAWGSGLMNEAASAAIDFIFNNYQAIQRISGCIINANKPAKNYLKRIGFRQDGLFKDFVTQHGKPVSMAHFGLTRREQWLALEALKNSKEIPLINPQTPVAAKEQALEASQTKD